jgi:hypothetical protein
MGFDAVDPSVRPFYTYGYVSNYLVPFLHVGGIAAWHVKDTWDLFAGIDCGSQTSFGSNDNSSLPAGYFGFGLNRLLGGKRGPGASDARLLLNDFGVFQRNPSVVVPLLSVLYGAGKRRARCSAYIT